MKCPGRLIVIFTSFLACNAFADSQTQIAHRAFLAGNYGEAIRAYERVKSPLDPSARLEVARSHLATGELDRARELAQLLVEDSVTESEALVILGDIHARLGQWHMAAEMYAAASEIESSRPEILVSLGHALEEDGQPVEADLAFATYEVLREH